MAENTAISWADHTFNPWVGCAKVSPACDGCYAQNLMERRMGRVVWGEPGKGEWQPTMPANAIMELGDRQYRTFGEGLARRYVERRGKFADACTLDGVTHDARPEVRA